MTDSIDVPDDVGIPAVDVCAFCADSECDGIGCIADLDPEDLDQQGVVEQLHDLLRAGAAWKIMHTHSYTVAEQVLAHAEHRPAMLNGHAPEHRVRPAVTGNGSSTVLGYMPQLYRSGAFVDALNKCCSLAMARGFVYDALLDTSPWRIVERQIVDGVVEVRPVENSDA